MVALHFADGTGTPLDVATARARVERARHGLAPTLFAKRPEELRRLARAALDAERAALRRRASVGPRPEIDEAAAARAVDAHAAVVAARASERDVVGESQRWLALGNAWGVAGLVAAGVLVARGGADPTSTAVYVSVLGAGAGPVATMMAGLTRRSRAVMRRSAAVAAWTAALEAAGVETMGQLHAARTAVRAWERRREESAAADRAARDARASWHRVAGPHDHPRAAPALVERMAALRAAQLELFRALVADRMRPRPIVHPPVPGFPFLVGPAAAWRAEGRPDPIVGGAPRLLDG